MKSTPGINQTKETENEKSRKSPNGGAHALNRTERRGRCSQRPEPPPRPKSRPPPNPPGGTAGRVGKILIANSKKSLLLASHTRGRKMTNELTVDLSQEEADILLRALQTEFPRTKFARFCTDTRRRDTEIIELYSIRLLSSINKQNLSLFLRGYFSRYGTPSQFITSMNNWYW